RLAASRLGGDIADGAHDSACSVDDDHSAADFVGRAAPRLAVRFAQARVAQRGKAVPRLDAGEKTLAFSTASADLLAYFRREPPRLAHSCHVPAGAPHGVLAWIRTYLFSRHCPVVLVARDSALAQSCAVAAMGNDPVFTSRRLSEHSLVGFS